MLYWPVSCMVEVPLTVYSEAFYVQLKGFCESGSGHDWASCDQTAV